MSIENMLALIWYIIRDYYAGAYSRKQVVSVAAEKLTQAGHTVTVGKTGNLTVDGVPYRIYKIPGWSMYDVRNTGV